MCAGNCTNSKVFPPKAEAVPGLFISGCCGQKVRRVDPLTKKGRNTRLQSAVGMAGEFARDPDAEAALASAASLARGAALLAPSGVSAMVS